MPNKKTLSPMANHPSKSVLHPALHAVARHAAHWLGLLVALALCACGPGTGGTGTGPQPTASIASTAPFAATYTSTPSAATVPGAATPSTGASSATTATVSLQLQTTGIVLTSACAGFNYSGTWSVSASGDITVQGIYTSATSGGSSNATQQTAILNIAFTNANVDSDSLTLRIQTPSGSVLLGPVSLQRSSAALGVAQRPGC